MCGSGIIRIGILIIGSISISGESRPCVWIIVPVTIPEWAYSSELVSMLLLLVKSLELIHRVIIVHDFVVVAILQQHWLRVVHYRLL